MSTIFAEVQNWPNWQLQNPNGEAMFEPNCSLRPCHWSATWRLRPESLAPGF
jgi:hypothetical protein